MSKRFDDLITALVDLINATPRSPTREELAKVVGEYWQKDDDGIPEGLAGFTPVESYFKEPDSFIVYDAAADMWTNIDLHGQQIQWTPVSQEELGLAADAICEDERVKREAALRVGELPNFPAPRHETLNDRLLRCESDGHIFGGDNCERCDVHFYDWHCKKSVNGHLWNPSEYIKLDSTEVHNSYLCKHCGHFAKEDGIEVARLVGRWLTAPRPRKIDVLQCDKRAEPQPGDTTGSTSYWWNNEIGRIDWSMSCTTIGNLPPRVRYHIANPSGVLTEVSMEKYIYNQMQRGRSLLCEVAKDGDHVWQDRAFYKSDGSVINVEQCARCGGLDSDPCSPAPKPAETPKSGSSA